MDAHIAVLRAQLAALRAELSRTQHELGLWKAQLDLAQKEILRAQQVVDEVDRARADAEERSHRYRQALRSLLEERAIQHARDEGRRQGYREGFQFGSTSQPSRPPPAASRAPPVSIPSLVAEPPPAPVAPRSHINNATYDVPPDNYIPTLPEGDPGPVLPPPHEWIHPPPAAGNDQSFAQSSHADPVGPPSSGVSRRSRMTLPERIADEWRSQNPDVQSQGDGSIPRPMSSAALPRSLPSPETPPQRPTTTAPVPNDTSRSSMFFRDGSNKPPGDWLQPGLRSVSHTSTPNIAVQSPSMSPKSPSNNTERTVVDSGLLSPIQQYQQPKRFAIPTSPPHPTPSRPSSSTGRGTPTVVPIYDQKIYPPGFIPLSPIPALSSLAAIPENTSSATHTGSSRSRHLSISTSKSPAPLTPSIATSKKPYYSTSSDSSTSYPNSPPSSVPVPGASSVHSRDW